MNPDIDEDTGTIDIDGGFEEDLDTGAGIESNDNNTSNSLSSSTSNVFSSANQNSTGNAQEQNQVTPSAPETKKSSATRVVSQPDALTPQTQQKARLPQTNEAKADSQALQSVGILVAVLTLGGGALIRHWF